MRSCPASLSRKTPNREKFNQVLHYRECKFRPQGTSGLGCLRRVSLAMNYSDFVGKVVFELCPTAGVSLFVVFKKFLDRL
jgi:hypothetical protein